MPRADLLIETPIRPSGRVDQLRGLFDLTDDSHSRMEWHVDLPIEERDWNIGLIVGPSGCGKTSIARHLWPKQIAAKHRWPKDASVVDAFPAGMGIKEVCDLLPAVGFSSPPSWLRPYDCLSNGEQFRVSIARTLAEQTAGVAVIDEFTSVVDRTVAQIGSAAVAKTVRRRGQRLVAVSCHEDIEAWLTPDWVLRPATGEFTWGCLQRRPDIELTISRVPASAWTLFRHHHYLDTALNPSAVCFAAFYGGRPVAFTAWLPLIGYRNHRREHRTVCLPDFQGVGIGNALSAHVGAMWKGLGIRASSTTSHPGMIAARNRSTNWAMTSKPSRRPADKGAGATITHATHRLVASFEFVGRPLDRNRAERLLRSQPV